MMNHGDAWMGGGGIWTVAGLLLVVFLVLAIARMLKK